jgi:hypothetical protein
MSDLLVWQCVSRISTLRRFAEALEEYAGHSQRYNKASIPSDNEGERARETVNLLFSRVAGYLREAGVYPAIHYVPGPALRRPALRNVDLLANVFQLAQLQSSYYDILDAVTKGIGYYEGEMARALIRTINPFWWLAKVVAFLISVPIRILAWAGFGEFNTLASSALGRVYKAVAGVVAFLAALAQIASLALQILEKLGS